MSHGARVKLGVLRLLDCMPALVAAESGFADEGISVEIGIEPSWANIADKLSFGHIDGALIPGALALAMILGLRGPRVPLVAAALVSREGNSVVVAPELATAPAFAAALDASSRPRRFAAVHAWSSHDLLLREFLHRRDVAANAVEMIALPPAEMCDAMEAGTISGFCVGAPWGTLAEQRGVGRVAATSADLSPGHPEKFLMLRAETASAQPSLAAALRRAIDRAGPVCRAAVAGDRPAQRRLAALLDLPAENLARSLVSGQHAPAFQAGPALVPAPADALWPLDLMRRHGLLSTVDEAAADHAASQFLES